MLNWLWPSDHARRALTILSLLFIVKQLLMIVVFPPFTGHDEVAHFDYVRTIANEHRIPLMPNLADWREAYANNQPLPGDFLSPDLYPYCHYALDWPCYPDDPAMRANPPYAQTSQNTGALFPAGWQYAANHPPLYYTLMAPLYLLSEPFGLGMQLRILRAGAIPFGLLAVICTFVIGRLLFPRKPMVAVLAATFVAFQPQISYEASMVNNDITVIGFGALLVMLLLFGLRDKFPRNITIGCGVTLGAAMLFKGTALSFAPIVAIAVVGAFGIKSWRDWVPIGGAIAAISFGIASPWYVFLYRHYGDLNGLKTVADLQASWNYPNGGPSFFQLLHKRRFIARMWTDSWGGFGWRRIPLEFGLLLAIGIVMSLCLLGMIVFAVRAWREWRSPNRTGPVAGLVGWQWWGVLTVFALAVLGYLAVVQFGTTFVLAQSRYLFPAIVPFAVLLALGWQTISPPRLRIYSGVLFVGLMIALNVFIYSAYVIPYWYLSGQH